MKEIVLFISSVGVLTTYAIAIIYMNRNIEIILGSNYTLSTFTLWLNILRLWGIAAAFAALGFGHSIAKIIFP